MIPTTLIVHPDFRSGPGVDRTAAGRLAWSPVERDGSDPPEAPVIDLTEEVGNSTRRGGDLVPVPRPPGEEGSPGPARLSDVDGWGRSERMRRLARTLYDPIYRHW